MFSRRNIREKSTNIIRRAVKIITPPISRGSLRRSARNLSKRAAAALQAGGEFSPRDSVRACTVTEKVALNQAGGEGGGETRRVRIPGTFNYHAHATRRAATCGTRIRAFGDVFRRGAGGDGTRRGGGMKQPRRRLVSADNNPLGAAREHTIVGLSETADT